MAHEHEHEHEEGPEGFHDHQHFGSLQTRLVVTLIGFILIVNAFLADKVFFPDQPAIGAISSLLGALILGIPIVVGGFRELRRGQVHLSALVAIAVVSAFVLSNYQVAGLVAFFMLLASLIEQQTAAGARESVEKLMQFQPNKAELVDGTVVEASELKPGDTIRLRPGDRVPADGELVNGQTAINEATITGESLPADKGPGDEIYAGTHNLTGSVEAKVTRAGENTTLGKVKRLILQAEATKTRLMQLIDRYAQWYTPVVLIVAAVVWVFTKDAERFITVLVISCPCAFVLATPTAMVAGLTAAARLGILVKNVAHLEGAGDLTAVVFDKTGTLTTGELTVTRLSPAEGVEPSELIRAAGSIEQHSRHPIALAVTEVAEKANIDLKEVTNAEESPGMGIRGQVGESEVIVGRSSWLQDHGVDMSLAETDEHQAEVEGMSLLYVARDGECLGWVGLEDKARDEAQRATSELKDLGINRLTMLTGDRWSVAKKVAGELGCTEVQAECLPEQKLNLVETMRQEGNQVGVVGDGVNDAPALAAGDLGIAMGAAGSDVAIGSASIALMSNDLRRLPVLVRLSRRLRRIIIQNLAVGAIFVVGGATLASFGILTPIVAAILHNVSSFLVIFNSARLVRFEENLAISPEKEESAPGPQPAAV